MAGFPEGGLPLQKAVFWVYTLTKLEAAFGYDRVRCHLYSRQNFKLNRAAALAEWRQLGLA